MSEFPFWDKSIIKRFVRPVLVIKLFQTFFEEITLYLEAKENLIDFVQDSILESCFHEIALQQMEKL